MKRPIVGYEQDEQKDWVALLDCGHRQHVRHHPPFASRPWTLTDEGRQSQLGAMLDCVRCERFELPEAFVPSRQTPVFTEQTIPAALRKDHSTRKGMWARIHVLEGRLRYRVDAWNFETVLERGTDGIVVPEVLHNVESLGQVRFCVEFYGAP